MVYQATSFHFRNDLVLIFRNADKIADLERKINGYRTSRDDELKNVVTLESRLNSCKEERRNLRDKLKNKGDLKVSHASLR